MKPITATEVQLSFKNNPILKKFNRDMERITWKMAGIDLKKILRQIRKQVKKDTRHERD